jgi:hypothetical protein
MLGKEIVGREIDVVMVYMGDAHNRLRKEVERIP